MNELERMNTGLWYDAKDEDILALHHQARRLCRAFNLADTDTERHEILSLIVGEGLGDGVYVKEPFQCEFPGRLILADRVFINSGARILNCGLVSIGEKARIAPGVTIIAVKHPLERDRSNEETKHRGSQAASVQIGARAWLCTGCIINPGITIGDDAVVMAGAVVTKDVEPGAVVGGVPAKFLRWRSESRCNEDSQDGTS